SEFVEMVLPLRFLSAEEYAYEAKKMMGPFGEVVVLRMGNRLLVHDTARRLRRILALTKEIEEVQTPTIMVGGYSGVTGEDMLRRRVTQMHGNPVEIKRLER